MINTKINVSDLLYEICEDESVYNPDFDLIESGLLDSYAFIELFSRLEDQGIILQSLIQERLSGATKNTAGYLIHM